MEVLLNPTYMSMDCSKQSSLQPLQVAIQNQKDCWQSVTAASTTSVAVSRFVLKVFEVCPQARVRHHYRYRESQLRMHDMYSYVADRVQKLVLGTHFLLQSSNHRFGKITGILPSGVQSPDMKIIDVLCLTVLFQLFVFALNAILPAPSILSTALLTNNTMYEFSSPDNTTLVNATK